jgi:hypothetical protein
MALDGVLAIGGVRGLTETVRMPGSGMGALLAV